MPEIVCDTSPLQYLHQIGQVYLLPELASRVLVPPAVVSELAVGRENGVDLPMTEQLEWLEVRRPEAQAAIALAYDLGPGEAEVLLLGLQVPRLVLVIDDLLARRVAQAPGLAFTGTLGILLDAKVRGLIPAAAPLVERLQSLRRLLGSACRLKRATSCCGGQGKTNKGRN